MRDALPQEEALITPQRRSDELNDHTARYSQGGNKRDAITEAPFGRPFLRRPANAGTMEDTSGRGLL